jgi:hypothetical protein
VAFDDKEKVAYLIGNLTLYVVDLSITALLDNNSPANPPRTLTLRQSLTRPTTLNDVAFCDGYLAVASNGEGGKVQPGSVTIFGRYARSRGEHGSSDEAAEAAGSLQELARFTVGEGCLS